MKAVLRLEMLGDDSRYLRQTYGARYEVFRRLLCDGTPRHMRPWVARIAGTDTRYGLQREFMPCVLDYTHANTVGSRGIYAFYPLDSGIYEVQERLSWGGTRRYFIMVTPPDYHEITREEVMGWLANATSA